MELRSFTVFIAIACSVLLPVHAASLAGLYQFNDPSNLGLDSSSNHNDLAIFGSGVSYTASGKYGGGLSLLGGGALTTGTGTAPNGFPLGNSNYTISAWFETSVTGARGLIGWGNYGTNNQVNAVRLATTSDSTVNGIKNYWWSNDLDASASTSDNVFHNITVTFDGSNRDLYFDSILIAADTPGSSRNVTNQDFYIGLTNSTEFFTGILDNVAVFNGALSSDEVSAVSGGDFSSFGVANAPEPNTMWLGAGAALLLGLALRLPERAFSARASNQSGKDRRGCI